MQNLILWITEGSRVDDSAIEYLFLSNSEMLAADARVAKNENVTIPAKINHLSMQFQIFLAKNYLRSMYE